jgi:hypothetical protein
MPLTITDLTTHLQKIMPKGFTVTATPFTDWITHAISEAIALAAPEFRERTFTDCIGDGVTTRYALSGYNIVLLPSDQQIFPQTINTAEVANPTAAPTAALRTGGSTIPAGAVLSFGFDWITAFGTTQLSPLGTITTSAANQTIDITIPVAPLGVTGCNIYVTGSILNTQYVSRVSAAHAISATATTLVTGLGLGDGVNFPLVDFEDPANVSFIEATSTISIEPGINADGSVNAAAASTTVITLATALTSGQRLRIWYTRQPQVPSSNSAPIFGVPDDFLYTATAAIMHRYLAVNHETGAKDQHWQVYIDLHNQALGMKDKNSARVGARVQMIEWGSQIR